MLRRISNALGVAAVAVVLGPVHPLACVSAQSAQTGAGSSVQAGGATGAAVVFAGDTLFYLFASLGPFSAAERATAVAQRLRATGARIGRGLDTLRVVDRESSSELLVGNVVILTILDADVAALNQPRPLVAAEYARAIQTAATESARRFSPRALTLGVVYAILATAVLIVLLRVIGTGFPRIYRRLEAVRRVRLPALRIQQFEIASAERLSQLLLFVARGVRITLTVLLFYVYVPLVLSFFPWTAALSRRIVGYAFAPLVAVLDGFIAYVPNVFYIAVITLVTRYMLKLVRALFRAVETGAITIDGFYLEWAEPTYKIARVLILAFAAVVIFPYLPGSNTDAFKGISIFLGVLFSLGSSSAVSNLVAGVVLTYTRAFRTGDRVRLGETLGDITERTLLVTRVRTIKNVEVTIPNAMVLGSHVVNYTTLAAQRGLIIHTTVTIGYDAPWPRVHQLLSIAARRTEHVLEQPAPFVLQTSLNDFYVSYELNAFTDRPDQMALTYSRLHANIQDAFNEAGVEIMSPHYSALRAGNATAIPAPYLPQDYQAPPFRLEVDSQPGAVPATDFPGGARP